MTQDVSIEVDDTGCHAEAIQPGLDWEMAVHSLIKVMKEPDVQIRISPTINLYSIPRMYFFVEFFHKLFITHGQDTGAMFNLAVAQEPGLSPCSMPKRYAKCLDRAIMYCNENDLLFADHLRDVQAMIGTKIDEHTVTHIESKWKSFHEERNEVRWAHLFPHVPGIIAELHK